VAEPLASGHYARKQIHCPDPVVAWSHGSRFALAARLAGERRGGRLLDYGCGDGTFLALTHGVFADAIGADVDETQLADCRRRLTALSGVRFVSTAALESPRHRSAYDVVTCMEVLEHCVEAERVRVLDELARLCRPEGRIVISVPIEIGPALAGKQFFRALAAFRGLGDYQVRETYSVYELARAVLARPRLARPEYEAAGPDGARRYCGHKGFDWRVLQREITGRLRLERRLFSPMPALGGLMNSQVWFVCRPTGTSAR
jgi:2-polyprenyl-3-methyl-5-hydroxy-6-metoxy-1,4-benzoquinol methylase